MITDVAAGDFPSLLSADASAPLLTHFIHAPRTVQARPLTFYSTMDSSNPVPRSQGGVSSDAVPQIQAKGSADDLGNQPSQPRSDNLAHSPSAYNGCGLCRGERHCVEFPSLLTLEDLLQGESYCYWYHIFAQAVRKCSPSLSQETRAFKDIGCVWKKYQSQLQLSYLGVGEDAPIFQRIQLFYLQGKSGYSFEFEQIKTPRKDNSISHCN